MKYSLKTDVNLELDGDIYIENVKQIVCCAICHSEIKEYIFRDYWFNFKDIEGGSYNVIYYICENCAKKYRLDNEPNIEISDPYFKKYNDLRRNKKFKNFNEFMLFVKIMNNKKINENKM